MQDTVSFYKDALGLPLTLYRGEIEHTVNNSPKRRGMRAVYFGDVTTANHYAGYYAQDYIEKTGRIYPVHLVLNNPFVLPNGSAYLELGFIVDLLGVAEGKRIALRFAKYIEETDNWRELINSLGYYTGVEHYFNAGGSLNNLYFQAYRFFDSGIEVNKLSKAGYDGAIHGGCGIGSEGKLEYCVFSYEQIYSTVSKSFMGEW